MYLAITGDENIYTFSPLNTYYLMILMETIEIFKKICLIVEEKAQ